MLQSHDPASCFRRQPGCELPMPGIIAQEIAEDIFALEQGSLLLYAHPFPAVKQECGIRDNGDTASGQFCYNLLSRLLPHTDVPDAGQELHGRALAGAGKL